MITDMFAREIIEHSHIDRRIVMSLTYLVNRLLLANLEPLGLAGSKLLFTMLYHDERRVSIHSIFLVTFGGVECGCRVLNK